MQLLNQSLQVVNTGQMNRKVRRPTHPFITEVYPFQIQPICIAQVLPGETLDRMMVQARSVTPPIKNGLIGWWAEYFYFYVKFSQLQHADEAKALVVDPDYSITGTDLEDTTANTRLFYNGAVADPKINWVAQCQYVVTKEWFRDQDEDPYTQLVNGTPKAKVVTSNFYDSMALTSTIDAADVNVDFDSDGNIMASEIERARNLWMQLNLQGLTDKSYEDFMKSYGIKPEEAEDDTRPELLRHIRDWTYPTRIVDPADGSPTAACQWNIQERADKARFFKEPGFIFGIQVFRPKVYFKAHNGSLTSEFTSALSWLPGEVLNNIGYGLQSFASAKGPNNNASAGYTVDIRDLLAYGEQFANFDLSTATDKNLVALPSADCTNTEYVPDADIEALFTGTDYLIETDGVTSLNIKSAFQGDLTHAP